MGIRDRRTTAQASESSCLEGLRLMRRTLLFVLPRSLLLPLSFAPADGEGRAARDEPRPLGVGRHWFGGLGQRTVQQSWTLSWLVGLGVAPLRLGVPAPAAL